MSSGRILNTWFWAMLAAICFLLMLALSAIGHAFQSRLAADPVAYHRAGILAKSIGLFLVLALGFCVVPVFVHVVLAFQAQIGKNAEVPWIAFLLRHEVTIVKLMWTLMLLGSAVALPFAVRELILGDSANPP